MLVYFTETQKILAVHRTHSNIYIYLHSVLTVLAMTYLLPKIVLAIALYCYCFYYCYSGLQHSSCSDLFGSWSCLFVFSFALVHLHKIYIFSINTKTIGVNIVSQFTPLHRFCIFVEFSICIGESFSVKAALTESVNHGFNDY